MRLLFQRVSSASVRVEGEVVGQIGSGALLLVGVGPADGPAEVEWMAEKVVHLRVFPDDQGRMNRSMVELGHSALVVSQFTLWGDCSRGRRPSFAGAAPPALAEPLYDALCQRISALGVPVARGRFGADMKVELVNDGPVTLWLERGREP
jgi:D-tyrosyl-tRNA(Tyr) deacylase